MRRTAAALLVDGQPVNWLGANFWSRTGGPLMWRNYQPDVIDAELAVLREHGLWVTRSFFYWPDFMPEPDRIDEQLAGRFADFLDRHTAQGMSTVPTFVVGHMSGENWDPAWRQGRDLYADVWLVARQAWFVKEMVRRFAGHPAVGGWLISNEMPIYGGKTAGRETVASWAQLVVDAVRAGGGQQPVSLGDGAWGIEVSGQDNGFWLRDAARLCDFIGPHVYRMEDDQIRQNYAAAWACELSGTFGKPVVLEEFGVSSDFVSEPNAAHYYRQVLHNSLLAGATGWIAWNNTDYDTLLDQDPYRHHPFELHFGLTDVHGNAKPQLVELRDFAATLAAIDFPHCQREDADTALVVSSFLDTPYPFTEPADGPYLHDTLRQSYVSARLADLPVVLTRESDGLATDARLYLVPSTKQLLGPTWHELDRLAVQGATVYVSYSPGTHSNQRGPWYANLNTLFGVRHQLRYGLVEPVEDERIVFTFERDFGGMAAGATLSFAAGGTVNSRTFLPVEPDGAEVLAVDAHGRPALLLRRTGTGSVVFCTYPIEHMTAVTAAVNPNDTVGLYEALADHAGVRRPVTVADSRVAVDTLRHEDGRRFAVIVSHADTELAVKPVLAEKGALHTLTGEAITGPLQLPPFGVTLLRLET
ncbi:MAG TPA: cellulase family glycosylhydrolase [Pseudonocardiaceae bacterium]|jgi:endo-1,4-beta-mannosidase|nr:cellulase family glycosylhydrolase [Pseudonocardiaceae bacterium]